ncbi:MAG TPA: tRNA pseudouridine(55) synthase TruB [Streptosporangiaceae bacterium]
MTAPGGLIIADKPGGMTSHDVVARIRRLAGTRRVGHAGTLDPMATGVLVVGVEKATRLLGHLALTEKEYDATIRLGQATDTDDAEGQIVSAAPAGAVTPGQLDAAVAALRGEISQVPPLVSAIKVSGERAYKLTRQGAPPKLEPRTVTVREFTVRAVRSEGSLLDADVSVTCSSGTYIRALARDLGLALGTGGHLTCLRRTRVGPYRAADARTLDELAAGLAVLPLADAAAAAFPRLDLTGEQAVKLAHGGKLDAGPEGTGSDPVAAFGPDGSLIALVTREAGRYRPLAVFA